MPTHLDDYSDVRFMSRLLTMSFIDNMSQAEIAETLNLSTAKVSRLLKQARQDGLIEIKINIPYHPQLELERKLEKIVGLDEVIVVPSLLEDQLTLQSLGRASAKFLMDNLEDGDIICVSGGAALYNLIHSIEPRRNFDVKVVPMIGGVQGRHYADVNFLTAELASRIGGEAYQLHAPAFVDTAEERESLCSLRHVKEILDMARQARIALVGIGTLTPPSSSYFQFTSLSQEEIEVVIDKNGGVGQMLAHIYDIEGNPCVTDYGDKVVGLTLEDLKAIPFAMGVAGLEHKLDAIVGALNGGYLKALATDEIVASHLIENWQRKKSLKNKMVVR